MAIIKVPFMVSNSPQDGSALRFDTDTETFSDESGNTWSVDELARARPANAIRKWVRENRAKGKG